jgi:hypothetical protein
MQFMWLFSWVVLVAAVVTVVGAGPAGLMAAETLAHRGFRVTVLDHMASPARKFLMAGRGGLNLTHSEPLETFLDRYGPARARLEPAIRAFPPEAVVGWCNGLGIETFTGSSGRIFPKSMKASPQLRAWLRRLDGLGVEFRLRTRWTGFDGTPTILALGGASWPRLGSDAAWVPVLRAGGVTVNDFTPSNAGIVIPWSDHFRERFAGKPLKRIAVTAGGRTVKGEAMITRHGLEGGALYALSRELREARAIAIDLRPDLSGAEIEKRLATPRGKLSTSNWLRRTLGLSPEAIALLREAKADASHVRHITLPVEGSTGLDRAISSAGGIALDEVDDTFRLRKIPNAWAIGEMLDWEAPTGGYLLQACFSMGVAAGRAVNTA